MTELMTDLEVSIISKMSISNLTGKMVQLAKEEGMELSKAKVNHDVIAKLEHQISLLEEELRARTLGHNAQPTE